MPDLSNYTCQECGLPTPSWRHRYCPGECRRRARRRLARACRDRQRDRWVSRSREYRMENTYGISIAEYEAMSAAQGHVCAICEQRCSSGRRLCVDHDHQTGKVRSLLCARCNSGIADFQDNPKLLRRAIDYLDQHAAILEMIGR